VGADDEAVEQLVWKQLRTCFDPEIPINVVDLGLVYEAIVKPDEDQPGQRVIEVRMTLTAPGCGMGPVLVSDVQYRVGKVPNVDTVKVDLVFDPPWSKEMMSEEAQLEAGLFF
jgi:probable FeS assembly SUF system protein SufT